MSTARTPTTEPSACARDPAAPSPKANAPTNCVSALPPPPPPPPLTLDSESDDSLANSFAALPSPGAEARTNLLLGERARLLALLGRRPYDLYVYLERAHVHSELGYPDLAAGDAYRALLLTDEVLTEGFEYHEVALRALERRRKWEGLEVPVGFKERGEEITEEEEEEGEEEDEQEDEEEEVDIEQLEEDEELTEAAKAVSLRCYRVLSISLLLCGCLKSAYEFCQRGLNIKPEDEELLQAQEYILNLARRRLKIDNPEVVPEVAHMPDQGLVRREIYPWNEHEPDRFSTETLDFLNEELAACAPKVEVRATELPTLVDGRSKSSGANGIPTNKQLGLFAKEDIAPGETVLNEFSILTANNRLKDTVCDACSEELPPLGAETCAIPCGSCHDTSFCSQHCYDYAMDTYHPAVCDKDLDTYARDPSPAEKPNALYLLLLARALAMSETQSIHPLDLKEVKYIWGDFLPSTSNAVPLSPTAGPPPIWTLPFSWKACVMGPLHILEKMDIDIFTDLEKYDLWVVNTLYAKFRGTASARLGSGNAGRRTAGPEVAAVHPLWCLANHDCDPNTQWEWGGRMRLWARDKRVGGGEGGIKKGDEVLNHYCDIELSVRDRREWAAGSLGGWCMCDRCRREAAEEEKVKGRDGKE
jgi:hypothetical protein